MAGPGRTVYIIGAGIAGLTLALALAKFGTTVIILEHGTEIPAEGAGIQLSPNARRILDRLGLARALNAAAFAPEAIDVYPFRRREPLVSLKLGATAEVRFGAPYSVIHRAELARILHQACRRFANIDIRFGTRAFDIETHARGISMIVEDRTGETRNVRPFAVVGADGVHSQTRRAHLGGPDADYTGYVAWRAMVPFGALDGKLAMNRSSLIWGPGYHAVAYPITATGEFNVAMFTKVKPKKLDAALAAGPRLPGAVLKSPHFDAIMQAAQGWNGWPVYTVQTSNWHKGAVGLVGDAAHAMLPFQAQGAAMAIEDAAVLAPLLMTEPDAASAMRLYQAQRRKRVRRVASLSRRNGTIFHLEWPFTIGRDIVVGVKGPLGHFDRLGWVYGYDPSPEIEAAAPPHATSAD